MILLRPKRWTNKPPVGAQINWGHPLARGLAGCWVFNEGAGSVLDLVRGIVGTFVGGATWIRTKMGSTVAIDGTAGARLDLGDTLNPASLPVSVVTHVDVKSLAATGGVFTTDRTTATHSGMFLLVRSTGAISLEFGDNLGGGAANRRTKLTGASVVAVDVPISLVGVIRGATDMTILVNGIDRGGTYSGTGGAMTHTTRSAWIGASDTLILNGRIAYVYFYTSALQDSDARWLTVEPYAFLLPMSPRLRYFFPSVTAAAADVYSGRGIGRGVGRGIYR